MAHINAVAAEGKALKFDWNAQLAMIFPADADKLCKTGSGNSCKRPTAATIDCWPGHDGNAAAWGGMPNEAGQGEWRGLGQEDEYPRQHARRNRPKLTIDLCVCSWHKTACISLPSCAAIDQTVEDRAGRCMSPSHFGTTSNRQKFFKQRSWKCRLTMLNIFLRQRGELLKELGLGWTNLCTSCDNPHGSESFPLVSWEALDGQIHSFHRYTKSKPRFCKGFEMTEISHHDVVKTSFSLGLFGTTRTYTVPQV